MKIAIDLNDVLRDYSKNFAKYYKREYNHLFDLDSIEYTTNNMREIFPFSSDTEYNKFVYEDYSFELYGRCDTVTKQTPSEFLNWMETTLKNIDTEEEIDVIIVSPMEYGLTLQSTFFFLSKLGCRARETYFPKDSSTIWDKCDMLVTANPYLLENKPEGKISVKIETDYNKDSKSDETFKNVSEFFEDENNVAKYLKKNA